MKTTDSVTTPSQKVTSRTVEPRIYGQWAGNQKGIKEDASRCIEAIYGGDWYTHQCRRKRGFGKDGLYCKQHAKDSYDQPNN